LRKVIVHNVQQWSDQRRETQKGFLAQMRLLDDLYISRIRRQHPYGNLQAPSGTIHDSDRAISSLGFADDLKAKAAEWMEWIEKSNVLGFCAQGIVGVGASIRMCICSSRPGGYPQMVPLG
jgi:hypothetical protein